MFTFSQGFEAATLKIPNKEYTAYNALLPSSSAQHQRPYPADPYNLGGVVLDGGRDGMASWPAPQHDDLAAHHYNLNTGLPLTAPNPNPALATSSNTLNLPQRKQIIGFAKFRTRDEALTARDILQGRRVDIEKGAVLKAEMAKKNLHTKRGVGPVPGSLPPSAGGPSNPGLQIQQQHDNTLFAPPSDFAPSSLPSQQNSMPALSRLGWRDSVSGPLSVGSSPYAHQQIADSSISNSILNGLSATTSTTSPATEDDRKRDSTSTSLLTLGGLGTGLQNLSIVPTSTPTIGNNVHQLHLPLLSGRGARERAAADDDEQQWRRKEENLRDLKEKEREKEANLMKLRAKDSVTYDAFHRVGGGSPSASNLSALAAPSAGVIGPAQSASGISRQSSSSTSLSLSTPLTSSTSNAPWTPNSVPTTVPSGDSENGRKLDDGGTDEENIELEGPAEVNRRQEEDGAYETLERRNFRDEQEQGESERGTLEHLSTNTNVTTTNEIVGPWDRINAAASYAAAARSSVPATVAARTRTGSERSTSPPPPQPPSSFSLGPNLGMNGPSSSHQHLGLHQQQYSNQYGYHQTPQPSPQVQSQSYQNQYQHLHMHQQQMLHQQQQQREREAYMQYQQQQQYRSTQSESGESNGDPTSSTNPVGYVGSGAARLGMLNTNTNGTSPNLNANANAPPSASSSSSMTLSRHQSAFAGNGVGDASGVASVPSSSTSSSSNNGGNASPQLPSPTSGGSSGGSSSTTSLTSAISVGGGGSGALRGTVDQNPPVSVYSLLFMSTVSSQLYVYCYFFVECRREKMVAYHLVMFFFCYPDQHAVCGKSADVATSHRVPGRSPRGRPSRGILCSPWLSQTLFQAQGEWANVFRRGVYSVFFFSFLYDINIDISSLHSLRTYTLQRKPCRKCLGTHYAGL